MGSRLIVVLFSVYMQLWIISFQESGVLVSKEETDSIYLWTITLSIFCIIIVGPTYGFFSDQIDPRKLIPISFFFRGIFAIGFRFVDDPKLWYSYVLCIATICISIVQFISVEVLFMRNMKSSIRGTMNGLAFFFGSVGTTTFAYFGGQLFDEVGPWAPFALVGTCDLLTVGFALIYIALGLLNKAD